MPPTRLQSHAAGAVATALLILCSGCCDLATYLCGPDRRPWPQISYQTPTAALETFQEAVRRDNVRVICESLAPELKARWQLPGCFEAAVAWEHVKAQTPGAHMLGHAKVESSKQLSDARVQYQLEVAGVSVLVELVRLAYTGVHFSADGEPEPRERYLASGTLDEAVKVSHGTFESQVQVKVTGVELPQGADVTRVIATYEWKVSDLRRLADT